MSTVFRILSWFDPFNWLLRVVLRKFLSKNAGLDDGQADFVRQNIDKHRKVQWVNAAGSVLVVLGLRSVSKQEIPTVIAALIAPVMVTGVAWFAISFGAIPKKLADVAMQITAWMFAAFTLSLSAMMLAVSSCTPRVFWPDWAIIYLGVVLSCVLYDTADGLKAGLDEAVLGHARYATKYYEREGIQIQER